MEAPATVVAASPCTSFLANCAVVTGGAAPTYLGIGAAVTGSIDGGGVGCGVTQMCIYMRRIYLYSYVCVCIMVLDCVSKINHGLHRWWDQRLPWGMGALLHMSFRMPHMQQGSLTYATGLWGMGWLRWVGSLKLQVSFAKEHYKRDDMIHSHMQRDSKIYATGLWVMGWLRWVGSLKIQVSFAKEPYKRDDILQKRPIILRSLLIVATP